MPTRREMFKIMGGVIAAVAAPPLAKPETLLGFPITQLTNLAEDVTAIPAINLGTLLDYMTQGGTFKLVLPNDPSQLKVEGAHLQSIVHGPLSVESVIKLEHPALPVMQDHSIEINAFVDEGLFVDVELAVLGDPVRMPDGTLEMDVRVRGFNQTIEEHYDRFNPKHPERSFAADKRRLRSDTPND